MLARTAQTTNGEVAIIATIVGMFKMVVIKMKIISIMIVMMLSMIFNKIGFILFDIFIASFLPLFILAPFHFYDLIFCFVFGFVLVSSGAWSYRWSISSNTYEAYRLVLQSSYRLLKEGKYSKVKSKMGKIEQSLRLHLK